MGKSYRKGQKNLSKYDDYDGEYECIDKSKQNRDERRAAREALKNYDWESLRDRSE